ncbi:RHS repeat domain-containing protein [Pirellulaceae bacterium SH449]
MTHHPTTTSEAPSSASLPFDASFDSIDSLNTSFTASEVPTLETTTVTEVALGYHRNQQYSITAMTTSTGAVAERYAYTAYGQPTICNASGTVLTSSAVGNRYTYTGREWDETLGLHHFRARWMSPLAGRFLGRDRLGYVDGLSLYRSYMSMSDIDPFGTDIDKRVRNPDKMGFWGTDVSNFQALRRRNRFPTRFTGVCWVDDYDEERCRVKCEVEIGQSIQLGQVKQDPGKYPDDWAISFWSPIRWGVGKGERYVGESFPCSCQSEYLYSQTPEQGLLESEGVPEEWQ